MFEALASKEPFHLGFQAAVVISPSLFISKQPTYCREREPFLQRSGIRGKWGGGPSFLFTHSGNPVLFLATGKSNPPMSGRGCWWKNVATWWDVCQAVILGPPPLCAVGFLMRGLGHWEPCSS